MTHSPLFLEGGCITSPFLDANFKTVWMFLLDVWALLAKLRQKHFEKLKFKICYSAKFGVVQNFKYSVTDFSLIFSYFLIWYFYKKNLIETKHFNNCTHRNRKSWNMLKIEVKVKYEAHPFKWIFVKLREIMNYGEILISILY